jgi:hypothetical protein
VSSLLRYACADESKHDNTGITRFLLKQTLLIRETFVEMSLNRMNRRKPLLASVHYCFDMLSHLMRIFMAVL